MSAPSGPGDPTRQVQQVLQGVPTPGGIGSYGNTFLVAPGQQQTVAGQLRGLMSGGLADDAFKRGERRAIKNGLMHSSIAGQAAENEALSAMAPIAQADAQLAAQANSQNADALNRMAAANLDYYKSTSGANGGNIIMQSALGDEAAEARQIRLMREESRLNREESADGYNLERERLAQQMGLSREEMDRMYGDRAIGRDFDREMLGQTQGFQSQQSQADRDWRGTQTTLDRDFQGSQSALDRQQQMSMLNSSQRFQAFGNSYSQVMNTLMSSPDYFRDPAAARGMLEFFAGSFGDIWSRQFGSSPGGG